MAKNAKSSDIKKNNTKKNSTKGKSKKTSGNKTQREGYKVINKSKYKIADLVYNSDIYGYTDSSTALEVANPNVIMATDDNSTSEKALKKEISSKKFSGKGSKSYLSLDSDMSQYAKLIYHSNNMFSEKELDIFNKTYRFGYFNTKTLSAGREYLFFTKPDLNIMGADGKPLEFYRGIPFWNDLVLYRPEIVKSLQQSVSYPRTDYFNHLLQNQCISSMDIPGLSAPMIETAVNDYGVGYNYRGSSEASDDNPEFSLEFKDSKWLDVFLYFKAYELYETMKHHGQVAPASKYIENRIIHDQFAIYKFIVGEDLETIIYWGKMYGVSPKSLPRDAFSNATFDNGISYSIDFQAAFYEDMVPDILADFNALSSGYYNGRKYHMDPYNVSTGTSDGRAAKSAAVVMYKSSLSPTGFVYKLKWKGDDVV